ncbi:MAG: hypothetical protein P8X68_12270 [Desulfobacterales bacterium]|jgi:hypothetical protein
MNGIKPAFPSSEKMNVAIPQASDYKRLGPFTANSLADTLRPEPLYPFALRLTGGRPLTSGYDRTEENPASFRQRINRQKL